MRGPLALVVALLGRLEPDTIARVGAAFGDLAFWLGIRRRVVAETMDRCLQCSRATRARIARRSYRSVGASMVQIFSYGRRGAASYDLEIMSPTLLKQVNASDTGVIFLTLHAGNWDVAGSAVAQCLDHLVVYATAQHNPDFDRLLNEQRRALGMDVQLVRDGDRRGALQVIRGLRDGTSSVGMLADQGPRPKVGVMARFFGHQAWCHQGPVFMARKAGARIIPGFSVRTGWNRYRLYVGRPWSLDGLSDDQAVQRCMDQIAVMIQQVPGQYFWHHRRFKRAMEAMPPTGVVCRHDAGISLLARPDAVV